MYVIAQLVDVLSQRIWTVVFIVCMASPVVGILVNRMSRGAYGKRQLAWLATYYALTAIAFGVNSTPLQDIPLIGVCGTLVVLSGVCVGIALCFS
jgi:hypothetical protein